MLLIGLAVGVDYSLFYLKREREERAKGHSTRDAVEIAAQGARRFPGDARLFSVYAQLVRAEGDSVIPRGLAAPEMTAVFPSSSIVSSRGRVVLVRVGGIIFRIARQDKRAVYTLW